MNEKKQRVNKRELIGQIKREFPTLKFSRAELIEYGDDHAVVILDRQLVFRFPRTAAYRKSFRAEVKLLATLKKNVAIQVPDYIFLPKNIEFGGYRLIRGQELTEVRFSHLSNSQQKHVIFDLANFLTALHGLNKRILPANRAAEPWSKDKLEQYKKQYWKHRRKTIIPFVNKEMLEQIDVFYDRFVHVCGNARNCTVIHGDLSGDHMLLDSTNKRLKGIIDFGDSAIGDPAHDFAFFWGYSDKTVETLYNKYAFHNDNKLLERSKWYYARYTIDRLWYYIRDRKMRRAAWAENILQKHMTVLLTNPN